MQRSTIDAMAHTAATSPKNNLPEPTQAQKEAGNYAKEHIALHGLKIAIENPKGSIRSGVSRDGKKWQNTMKHHYGYIKGTVGRDKDHIDVFIGDKPKSKNVYVVNQVNPETGAFDEHKVMLCFEDREEAAEAYLSNYEAGWKGMGDMVYMPMDDFREWLEYGDTKSELILESAADRENIRAFLDSIDPKRINALKRESYQDYLAILKSIVRKMFPFGAKIKFRKNGKAIDYEHFLKDSGRSKYIHSLPDTLKKFDIQIELEDQQKQYLIKKYFDPEIQKDIWDILVFHGDEIRTKIARKDNRGRNSVENIMMEKITENADGEGFWASIPSTPEGDTETASTLPNYDVNMPFNSDNVNIILESSTTDWKTKLTQSDDIDDISEVFRALFRADIPSSGSPYFKDTYSSQVMSIDKLIAREPADPQRVKRAHDHMQAAKSGDGEKRKPIYVLDMGNGQYKVLDGNTTLQALKELGETQAVVEIKKSLKQQVGDQKSLDAVYAQAEKALPEFKNWVEEYARKTGATRVMLRPGLKGRERAGQKVENDYAGCAARLTDIVGGTLLYDRVEDVVSAFKLIGKDPAVSKAKNRFENPTSDGYRDIMMVVNVGGHLCELQLNTHAILEAKEKGLGHKLYEITRQLKAIANNNKSEGGDLYFTARGYVDELTDISIKVYRNAAISSANSSASNMASDSEIGDEFNRILVQLSGSSISTHFSGFRESIRKMLPVNFSIAKATSSFSTKSNMSDFMADVTPFDDKNITRNGHKVNAKVIKGRYTRAYLNDGSLLKLQYAVVESDDLVTSHNTDFSLNPEFPQELQPRDRTRDTMRQQIASISGKLNPDLLGGSLYASVGSPIVGRDLVVESGNGRTMGIKTRYERDEAPQYKAWLIDTAQKIGVDPEQIKAMKRPVLVRIRISDQNRKTVTERANEGDIAAMSPVETAKVDSGRLQPDDMDLFHPGDDGEIATAANNAFITRFLKLMGPAESAGLLTADGKPTRQLLERIQAAVFDKAFHDERLLALMAEDANPDIRNILKALTMSAPAFARVKAMAGDEQIDAINHIVGAVDLIRRAKREGENVETILNQLGLFGEEIPEETALVTRFLVKNARSAKRIAEALQTVAAKYRYWAENQSQPDLFGNLPEKPSAMDVLRAALADNGGGSQPGLFESSLSNVPKPIMAIVDGLRLAVSIDKNQAPIDVPPNWIIFNAPRPLYGDKEWQGDFIHGRFYVAVDPNGDQAAWCVQQNKAMDAWVYQYVDKDTMRAMVRQSYIDGYFKGNVEKADKALKNFKDDFFMQGFRNILDKMVFGDFQRLEAKSIRKIDNQNRDMADLSKHREFLKQERIDGEKRAAEHHDRVAQNVPIPGWTTENGILVLRSGNSRYVAVPKTGKKNSARFDLIDLQSGQFLSILGKNEVADWLWRSAQTEFEDKHGYPPGAYIPDDIRNAKSMDEIVAVFERVFGGLGKSVI